MVEIDSAPILNAVRREKKSASVRQADVLANLNPIWPRPKICSSTTKNRLVCGKIKEKKKTLCFLTTDDHYFNYFLTFRQKK